MTITSLEQLKEYNSEHHSEEEKENDPVYVMEWWAVWIFTQKKYDDFKVGIDEMVKFTEKYEGLSYYEAVLRTTNNMKYIHNRWSMDDNPFIKNFNKLILHYFGYSVKRPWFNIS